MVWIKAMRLKKNKFCFLGAYILKKGKNQNKQINHIKIA